MVSLDMTKELATVQRTPKGFEARRYFIDVDKKWQASLVSPSPTPALQDPELPRLVLVTNLLVQLGTEVASRVEDGPAGRHEEGGGPGARRGPGRWSGILIPCPRAS